MENKEMWVKNETDKNELSLWKQIQEKHDSQLLRDNKYYTPDLSELYVCYEFEANWDFYRNEDGSKSSQVGGWKGVILKGIDQAVRHYLSLGMYRTKYLDSDDIISLGFERLNMTPILKDRVGFISKDLNLTLVLSKYNGTPFVEIRLYDPVKYEKMYNPEHFHITIPCKSKNELKTILSWIN